MSQPKYIVQRGDTLSQIAQKTWGDKMAFDRIAAANGIKDPNKIKIGQEIQIPKVSKKPYKLKDIPTRNKVNIIDNYSPKYNYIVEGNKMYYSIKGRDYWVDISDNDVARKNLYTFLHDKYNFKGYEDNERQVYNKLMGIKTPVKNKSRISIKQQQDIESRLKQQNTVPSDKTKVAKFQGQSKAPQTPTPVGRTLPQKAYDLYTLGKNAISRWWNKNVSDKKEPGSKLQYKETYKAPNSKYTVQPQSFTGDTIYINKKANPREYYIPENINLGDVRLGVRNRGDYTPLESEGAIITSLFEFSPYEKISNKNGSYFGIDKNGKFKAGSYDDFTNGDIMARTFSNNVESFALDSKGNIRVKDDAFQGNPGRNVPIVNVITDDGRKVLGSLNILTPKKSSDTGTYGTVTGGRVVMKAGNETRLVSGSIDNIRKAFEELKERNKVPYVTFYSLDNGTFNRGLRMNDNKFTSSDLRAHDQKNNGGGNFMYLLGNPNVFSSDTIPTPNVRTAKDESYKKGHPLRNSVKGIVNHHTAFMDNDLSSVINHLTSPNSEASSHVVIGYDGSRKVLANPDQVTFHGGYSRWNGQNNVNDFMIGVEFQGDTNKRPLTNQQIQSYVEYVKPIVRQYGIPLENIVTHQNVRDEYNAWAPLNGEPTVPSKPDINQENQRRLIEALRQSLYIQK